MDSGARDRMIRRFQNEDDEAMIIIGTAEVLGTGVTLNRASRLHLYEQNSLPKLWEQCYGRMWRFGNPNFDGVVVFEYCCANSVETNLRDRRDTRAGVAKAALRKLLEDAKKAEETEDTAEVIDLTSQD